MKFDIKYNKDFLIFVGTNESGKTTLSKYFVDKMPPKDVYVINSGGAKQWYNTHIPRDHIIEPPMYTEDVLNEILLKWVSNPKIQNAHVVIDDADNFNLKTSDIMRSIFINARRLNVGESLLVRRLSWVPIEIYDKAKYVFFARQNVNYSIYYISQLMDRSIAEKLRTLEPFVFLVYEPSNGNWGKIKLNLSGDSHKQMGSDSI